MIRPFRSETERYGEYSRAGEFVYDRPFLWGSKRTGPDLQRLGGKYPDAWHYNHMIDPASMSPGSIMPPYPWLADESLDSGSTPSKINAMRKLGAPYPEDYDQRAIEDLEGQAAIIVNELKGAGIKAEQDKKIVALIAYLQRLGTDFKGK
jgi:cytochrome c oxidase cbb3-type subunit I/II